MRVFVFFMVMLFSVASHASTPVEDFKTETDTTLRICKINSQTLIIAYIIGDSAKISDVGDRLKSCIKDGETKAKGKFGAAVKSVKKKAAVEKLKAYYAAWISALRSVSIRDGDSEVSHQSRVSENDQRLSDAWAVFEVESAL